MSEMMIGTLASLSIFHLAVGCFLYMWGGRNRKWIRRFVGSLVIAGTVNMMAHYLGIWQIWHLLVWPILALGFSLGYGGDNLREKLVRRTIFTVGVVSAGLPFVLTLGGLAWTIWVLHVGVGAFSIWLGTRNPLHAAAEETFVCLVLNTGLLLYPFLR